MAASNPSPQAAHTAPVATTATAATASRIIGGPRDVTPLRIAPSSGPYEAMVASQQAHIDQLVQRNTTLEHTVKKQREAILAEQTRTDDAISQLRERWRSERAEWELNIELIQHAHRASTLQLANELAAERARVSEERRKRKALSVVKNNLDFVIIQWQGREADLESQLFQLEMQVEELRESQGDSNAELKEQWEAERAELERTIADLEVDVEERDTELASLKVRAFCVNKLTLVDSYPYSYQKSHNAIQSEYKTLSSTHKSNSAKLERLQLQMEGLQMAKDTLQRERDEIARSNTELTRQIAEWQALDRRGGNEVEEERAKRIELEVQVRALEQQRDELTKESAAEKKRVTKAERTLEKYKTVFEEQKVCDLPLSMFGETTFTIYLATHNRCKRYIC
jgi:chromosome segregation ATPase